MCCWAKNIFYFLSKEKDKNDNVSRNSKRWKLNFSFIKVFETFPGAKNFAFTNIVEGYLSGCLPDICIKLDRILPRFNKIEKIEFESLERNVIINENGAMKKTVESNKEKFRKENWDLAYNRPNQRKHVITFRNRLLS